MATTDVLERHFPGRRAELKRTILAHALASFNDHGIEPTTIDMIKARCETSVGAIYHHFGNKEGLVAALFFCALDDQARLLEQQLGAAATAQEGVAAMVGSYVDWVTAQPDLARFQFQAGFAVSKGPRADELAQRNKTRNQALLAWLAEPAHHADIGWCPRELLPSLVIGPAENYCRAWLAGRVRTPPAKHRDALAQAVWRSIAG